MPQAPAESQPAPNAVDEKIAADRQLLLDARQRGRGPTLKAYLKLSGPGWLQSAITLGGGSLAGSLYLGVLGGYQFMWLQPLMMILGIVMLSAIAYVTLSTGQRPFDAIRRHVNPALAWGWLIASMMANLVWAMPQFSLGTAALEQNLAPSVFGGESGKYLAVGLLFLIGLGIVIFYDSGSWGVRVFEWLLKGMVAVVVVSFFGVVFAMSVKGNLAWGSIFAGFIPDFSLLREPADTFQKILPQTTDPDYWRAVILTSQQDRMITAAATAVGINMTFLLPYSMLRKGWDKTFTGLATFDLSTGLFIPFVIATSCVVIAAAGQFHGEYDPGLIGEAEPTAITQTLRGKYEKNLSDFSAQSSGAVPNETDKKLAAMLVERDANTLALSLEKLTGPAVAQYVFGIGVVGMAISTIIILMLINGFCVTEMLGQQGNKKVHLLGAVLPGITGALGFLLLWGNDQARFWLAVPTSRFGMILLPVAYITFFCMMNSRALLGAAMPTGGKRIALNAVMLIAIVVSTIGSALAIWNSTQGVPGTELTVRQLAIGAVVIFALLVAIMHFARRSKPAI